MNDASEPEEWGGGGGIGGAFEWWVRHETHFVLQCKFYKDLKESLVNNNYNELGPSPINCFVFPLPGRPTFFKISLKENKTNPYFWKFQ